MKDISVKVIMLTSAGSRMRYIDYPDERIWNVQPNNDAFIKETPVVPFHLYFCLKEEINKGDQYLFDMYGNWEVMECRDNEEADRCNNHPDIKHSCIKILATTNSACRIPSISSIFLHQYTAANGKIDNVRLEVIEICKWCKEDSSVKLEGANCQHIATKTELKLTEDNEVIVVDELSALKIFTVVDNISKHISSGTTVYGIMTTAVEVIVDKELEESAKKYAGITRNIDDEERYFNKGIPKYDAFKEGAIWNKGQFKKDLLEAINHTDAIDCMIGLANTKTQDLEDIVDKLKVSLDNLRKLL